MGTPIKASHRLTLELDGPRNVSGSLIFIRFQCSHFPFIVIVIN